MRFHMPTEIMFAPGAARKIKETAEAKFPGLGIYCITDKGVQKAGITDSVLGGLAPAAVFNEVEPNPRHETINRAGDEVRRLGCEIVLGIGGGSVLDAAKAVALLAANPGGIEEYEGKARYSRAPLPVIAVPTTCGTGSEVTWVSVITHTERRFKMSIKGPEMFPRLAVVDPDLLKTLPAALVASTGLDALTHAVEAYTVKPATPVTDCFARESLQLIFDSLKDAWLDIAENDEAREKLMMGSMVAGIAFGNSDVGAVHCIAEAIGSLYDTPHGTANSVFLPYVMEYNLPVSAARYADIARIAGIDEENDEAAALRLIRTIHELCREMGIPAFSDLGVREEDFDEIAGKSFVNNSNPSNPREVEEKDYKDILLRAFHSGS